MAAREDQPYRRSLKRHRPSAIAEAKASADRSLDCTRNNSGESPRMKLQHASRARSLALVKDQDGFTLIELLIVIVIVAILTALALPSYWSTIQANRIATDTNALVSDLHLMRSEAVKRNASVTMCPSSNGSSCTANAWQSGRLIFTDLDGDGAFSPPQETLLRVREPMSGSNTIEQSGFGGAISFSTVATAGYRPAQVRSRFVMRIIRGIRGAASTSFRPAARI